MTYYKREIQEFKKDLKDMKNNKIYMQLEYAYIKDMILTCKNSLEKRIYLQKLEIIEQYI